MTNTLSILIFATTMLVSATSFTKTLPSTTVSCDSTSADDLIWQANNCVSARLPSGTYIEIPKALCPPRGNEGHGFSDNVPGESWVTIPVLSSDGVCTWQDILIHFGKKEHDDAHQ